MNRSGHHQDVTVHNVLNLIAIKNNIKIHSDSFFRLFLLNPEVWKMILQLSGFLREWKKHSDRFLSLSFFIGLPTRCKYLTGYYLIPSGEGNRKPPLWKFPQENYNGDDTLFFFFMKSNARRGAPVRCCPYGSRKTLALPKRRESWSSERVEA